MVDNLTPDNTALATLYGNWIKRIALLLKVRMPWADLEELLQWGAIGMMEASQRFNASHGTNFQAFAAQRIRGAMIDGLRREGSFRRGQVVLDIETIDSSTYQQSQGPEDPMTILSRQDDRSLLAKALRTLPTLEYQILALHFYEELNNREIASVLDISEGYASRLRKRALDALAAYIAAAQRGEYLP